MYALIILYQSNLSCLKSITKLGLNGLRWCLCIDGHVLVTNEIVNRYNFSLKILTKEELMFVLDLLDEDKYGNSCKNAWVSY